MNFTPVGTGSPFLLVELDPGEQIRARSKAMVSMDASLALRGKLQGGIIGSWTRKLFAGGTFFTQAISAERGAGQALLAPALPGDILVLAVGARQFCLTDGAFLAAESSVGISSSFQSIEKVLFGAPGGYLIIKTSGQGLIAVAGFGCLTEVEVQPGLDLVVDMHHLVGWDRALDYTVSLGGGGKQGVVGRMLSSMTGGEGFVANFSGSGSVLLSSRNLPSFTQHLGRSVFSSLSKSEKAASKEAAK